MSKIVCAIRGGPYSQATINKAIDLARDTSLQITFLYIVNLDFLARSTSLRTHTIRGEMEEMGEFILLTAQNQAAAQGVTAEGLVRDGQVGEEIIKLCNELGTFAMLILTDRAERRGVAQVDYVLREGNIRQGLINFAKETHAEMMVMGRPMRSPGRNVFKIADFDVFVDDLEYRANLRIVKVPLELSRK